MTPSRADPSTLGVPPESDRSASFERRALIPLTAGLWVFAFASFAGSIAASTLGRMPPWLWSWLFAITATGAATSLALYALSRALPLAPLTRRWIVLGVAVLIGAGVQSGLDGVLSGVMHTLFGVAGGSYFRLPDFTFNWLIYVWLLGFYVATLEMLGILERTVALETMNARYAIAAAEARELAREAQLQMLRFQLNPHFLFNTLNGISSLVLSGRTRQAEEMLQRLSRFLRASLIKAEDGLVPLDHELTAAEAYLDIEAVRFADALNIEIDCEAELSDALVPSLILQPLIENAVKYALGPTGGAGSIRLAVRREASELTLDVIDNGAGATPEAAGAGVGLENVRQRLAAMYGGAAELITQPSPGGFTARIRLPFRRLTLEAA